MEDEKNGGQEQTNWNGRQLTSSLDCDNYSEKEQVFSDPKGYFTYYFLKEFKEFKEFKESEEKSVLTRNYEKKGFEGVKNYLEQLQKVILSPLNEDPRTEIETGQHTLERSLITLSQEILSENLEFFSGRIKYYKKNITKDTQIQAQEEETLAILAIILTKFKSYFEFVTTSVVKEADLYLLRQYAYTFNSLINNKKLSLIVSERQKEIMCMLFENFLILIAVQRLKRGRRSFFFFSDTPSRYLEQIALELIDIQIKLRPAQTRDEQDKRAEIFRRRSDVITPKQMDPVVELFAILGPIMALLFIWIGLTYPLFFIGAVGFIFPIIAYIEQRELDKKMLLGFKEIVELTPLAEDSAMSIKKLLPEILSIEQAPGPTADSTPSVVAELPEELAKPPSLFYIKFPSFFNIETGKNNDSCFSQHTHEKKGQL